MCAAGTGKACFYVGSTLAGGVDYNDYYATGGASVGYIGGLFRAGIGAWRSATGKDWNSLSEDPLFVDAGNGDWHLQSTSGSGMVVRGRLMGQIARVLTMGILRTEWV